MAWKDEIDTSNLAHLYFTSLSKGKVYSFRFEDFWNPYERMSDNPYHADYLVWVVTLLTAHPQNSLGKNARIKLGLPKRSFTVALQKALASKEVEMCDNQEATISITKANQKTIEILKLSFFV